MLASGSFFFVVQERFLTTLFVVARTIKFTIILASPALTCQAIIQSVVGSEKHIALGGPVGRIVSII